MISSRSQTANGTDKISQSQLVEERGLIQVERQCRFTRNIVCVPEATKAVNQQTADSSGQFAVSKLLFTNFCSLTKTKNKVRAVVALEADMINNDIDVCVVSETHLKAGHAGCSD